jgi:transposase-like protein
LDRQGGSIFKRRQQREVKELRRANDILKTASAFFAQAELDRRLKS